MRAILLASATLTSMRGFLASMPSSHEPAGAPRLLAWSTTALLPMMSSRRSVRSPILEIAPSFCLPPVDACFGTNPSQAAKSRPLANVSAGGAIAAMAVAVIGPMPGIDGQTHHVSGIEAARVEDARIGSIVEIGPAESTVRPADRAIAEDGIYRPSRHLKRARFDGHVVRGDYEGFVDAHVRRLEALRRAGIAERIDADQWRIRGDFEVRAAAHDAGRNGRANIRITSNGRSDRTAPPGSTGG